MRRPQYDLTVVVTSWPVTVSGAPSVVGDARIHHLELVVRLSLFEAERNSGDDHTNHP